MSRRKTVKRPPARARRALIDEAILTSVDDHPVRKFTPETPKERAKWQELERHMESRRDWEHLVRHGCGRVDPHCLRCRRALKRISAANEKRAA